MGKARLILLVLLASAGAAGAVPAAPVPVAAAAAQMVTGANPPAFAEIMRSAGFLADLGEDKAGAPRIITGFAGVRGNIWFYDCEEGPCEAVQLQVGIVTDRKITLGEVNAFNHDRRFASLSLDGDGDPILRQDLSLLRPGVSGAVLIETLKQFENQVADLRDMVEAREKLSR